MESRILRFKKLVFIIALSLLFLLIKNTTAFAEILGDRIKPFLSVGEVYDSNVFRVKDVDYLKTFIDDDQLSDFLTTAAIGVNLNYQVRNHEMDILLRKDFLRYSHYTGQNSEQDEVKGHLFLKALDRVVARINGDYAKVAVEREDYQTQQKNERTTATGGISLGYNMPSGFTAQAGFGKERVDFSLASFKYRERERRDYSGVLYYSPSTDAKFSLIYHKNDFDYDFLQPIYGLLVNNDSTEDTIRFGIDRSFGPKADLSFNAGYLWRKMKEFKARDFHGAIGKAELHYRIAEKLTLSISGERKLHEAIFLDQTYSVNELVGAGIIYRCTEKITTFVDGSTSRNSYKGDANIISQTFSERTDKLNEFRIGAEWSPVRQITTDLSYRYGTRDSNFDTYDYEAHRVELGITYEF